MVIPMFLLRSISTIEFISNFIKHERHVIISKHRRYLIVFLYHQSFDVEKTVARQHVQILLLYGYPYLVAMPKRSVDVWIVHVSLKFDAIIKNR